MTTLNFTSVSLPVSKQFQQLLSEHCQTLLASDSWEATSKRLTLSFRDKSYSVENGGSHPVEVGLNITNKVNVTIIYITDFAYVGNLYPEIKRHIDFDFSHQLYFTVEAGWQRIQSSKVEDLYRIWEKSFIKHVREGGYDEIKVIL
ncbi:DUF2787 domain-containing protein [Vibrio parahaemolyticus]|uniref:DUF2787 family protein n=1 Tax=Vibrio TaxID=662 RepID=UPI00168D31D2|nr:DUF2787 family protein [Vibrio parahaemolyticus]EJB8535357.1 DUF2787 domain-containing protein [Vibrio parahaemolyticus]ELB2952702.1 DUF2787 domain-containing protein [Vibrio parahaemolyticus]MCR9723532.1 DUF2787 domain-containing protein [Vibrio parahaemolyticus]MCR9746043.1 DUF2787 domain-containing protein [Vibrio parahaemolyticus]MCZ6381588.1 DUF2787 family protein [Vibrio parahaemolyticus]